MMPHVPIPASRLSLPTARYGPGNRMNNGRRQARQSANQHEPSSPIPVLLRRAEQFVGKRYAEVVKAISPEMLAQWESDDSMG